MQANGRRIYNGQYVDLRPLGSGQYGRVRMCLDLATCRLVAVKLCSRAALRSSSRLSLESRRPALHGIHRGKGHQPLVMDTLRAAAAGPRPLSNIAPTSSSSAASIVVTSKGQSPTSSKPPASLKRRATVDAAESLPKHKSLRGHMCKVESCTPSHPVTWPSSQAARASLPSSRYAVTPRTLSHGPVDSGTLCAGSAFSVFRSQRLCPSSSVGCASVATARCLATAASSGIPGDCIASPNSCGKCSESACTAATSGGPVAPPLADNSAAAVQCLVAPSPCTSAEATRSTLTAIHLCSDKSVSRAPLSRSCSSKSMQLADTCRKELGVASGCRSVECSRCILPEASVLRQLCHPNVVQLLAAIDDPSADDVLLIMEFVSCGTLEQLSLGGGRCASMPLCMGTRSKGCSQIRS
jgi:hypothetical protein